jgi:hypothetical protein
LCGLNYLHNDTDLYQNTIIKGFVCGLMCKNLYICCCIVFRIAFPRGEVLWYAVVCFWQSRVCCVEENFHNTHIKYNLKLLMPSPE